MGVDGPVLPRRETLNLAFPLHDQPRRHRLHAASGEAAPDLLPEEGAQAVTDQPVQHASRLLGVHELHIDITGVAERFADRLGRDLMEHHADVVLALQFGSRNQVPGDRLALTVGVGGQVDGGGALRRLSYLLDGRRLLAGDDVLGLEILLCVHTKVGLGQVAYVTHGSPDLVVWA